jgi:hypothetical protein
VEEVAMTATRDAGGSGLVDPKLDPSCLVNILLVLGQPNPLRLWVLGIWFNPYYTKKTARYPLPESMV